MAIVEAISIPIGVTGQESVIKAAESYDDLGDAVAKTQREAERLALQYGITDEKTQEAIRAAGKYKNQLEQLDTAIDLNRSSLDLLLSATQSLIGGFQAAIGAAALFGEENEQLTRLLVKVQGAMALGEGIKNLRDLPKVVEGIRAKFLMLNTTLSTTQKLMRGLGIGAVIAGVVLLVKNIDGLMDRLKRLTDSVGLTNYALEEQVKSQERVVAQTQRQIDLNESLGMSEENLLKQKIDLAKENEKLSDLQLQYAEFQKDGVEEATKDNLDAINNVKMAENALTNFYINENKKKLQARQEFTQLMSDLFMKEIQDNRALLEQITQLEEEYLLFRYDPQGDYAKKVVKGRLFRNREAEIDAQKQAIDLINQKAADLKLIEEAFDKELISKERYERKKAQIDAYYKDLEFKRTQDLAQKQRDTQEEFAVGTAEMLLDLNNIFQGQREDQSKAEFERNKALAIGQTLIQTYFAAQKAYSSQIIPNDPTSIIRASIAAAFAVTAGLSKVATIRRVKYNDPSSGGSTGSTPALGAAVPRFQAPTTRVPGQGEEFTQVRRIFVTERDISNVQDKVRVTEGLSQF